MTVKNINGTSKNKCKCGSWLSHWHKYSGRVATICKAEGCSNFSTAGAHVQKYNSLDKSWYIIPFCHAHNRSTNPVKLNNGAFLVPANRALTCGL